MESVKWFQTGDRTNNSTVWDRSGGWRSQLGGIERKMSVDQVCVAFADADLCVRQPNEKTSVNRSLKVK